MGKTHDIFQLLECVGGIPGAVLGKIAGCVVRIPDLERAEPDVLSGPSGRR